MRHTLFETQIVKSATKTLDLALIVHCATIFGMAKYHIRLLVPQATKIVIYLSQYIALFSLNNYDKALR